MSGDAELNEARRRIEGLGLQLREMSVSEETFGNAVADFTDDEFRLRLVRDRGQWFVQLGPAHGGRDYDLALHIRCLTDRQPTPDYSLEGQLTRLESSFAAIKAAYGSPGHAEALQNMAAQRKRELFG